MKKNLRHFFSLLALTSLLVLPYFVFAATGTADTTFNAGDALDRLEIVAEAGGSGYQESELDIVIGTAIRGALSLLGGVFIILMVIGGYDWMTAEGNEQKIEKAQNYIRRAIIGLIITLSSWAIWAYLLEEFVTG